MDLVNYDQDQVKVNMSCLMKSSNKVLHQTKNRILIGKQNMISQLIKTSLIAPLISKI